MTLTSYAWRFRMVNCDIINSITRKYHIFVPDTLEVVLGSEVISLCFSDISCKDAFLNYTFLLSKSSAHGLTYNNKGGMLDIKHSDSSESSTSNQNVQLYIQIDLNVLSNIHFHIHLFFTSSLISSEMWSSFAFVVL